jgi:hypothetical protein
MDDALLNCMTGVCCPPDAQAEALATEMVNKGICADMTDAMKCTKWVLKHFDLAPHGTLRPLTAAIARMARA